MTQVWEQRSNNLKCQWVVQKLGIKSSSPSGFVLPSLKLLVDGTQIL